jgi:hypothetical protein
MKFCVLQTDQAQDWQAALAGPLRTDIYFLPEYHRVYERNGDGIAKAFVAQAEDKVLFYPFMVRPIEKVAGEALQEEWFDIETVYGYSGPVANTTDAAFLSEAWQFFSDWCRNQRIVAEFVRFSPLLENYRTAPSSLAVAFDRETVVVEFDGHEESLWKNYTHAHRKQIRKAQRNGLLCHEMEPALGMSTFKALYYQTMQRNKAGQYYFFSDAYFEALVTLLGKAVRIFVVRYGGLIIEASLLLVHENTVYDHLRGSVEGYHGLGPNNLLLHKVALWCLEHKYRRFHLGGGRTPSPDDSLLRFKANMSKLRRRYHTGRRVHNKEAYEALCLRWMKTTNVQIRPNYFLLYRLEAP